MIHYHGTPITPRSELMKMRGRHFCVPFTDGRDLETCLSIGQSIMLDNGAYSAFTKGIPFDEKGFYEWIDPVLSPIAWAVIPDVIDGSVEQQREMVSRWPYRWNLGSPVYHLAEPITRLIELCDLWPRVCIGSSGRFWNIGTPEWSGRMDECFNELSKRHTILPWIHGLRMLNQTEWPLASADSTNTAQNHWIDGCPECLAGRLDATQPVKKWSEREIQQVLL